MRWRVAAALGLVHVSIKIQGKIQGRNLDMDQGAKVGVA